ncbi:Lrp/AsnC family transcriptional regulator [Sphingosinicella terrae]|uniref:Lrp/AsnC family transcriptional regulator n=1 Tax=Sphingosinicella terrae TaxID=2172047 RepID=UPI000E0DF3EB|nr:Lrp/AsnC family transcriptional regulator [Sphingosinicella terrae]
MDAVDRSILASLERDARQSFSTLAENVGLSKTPCWTRVQSLERSGALAGYYAEVDPRALGLGVYAFVQISIDFARRPEFETAVRDCPAVIECYTIAGDADYLAKVICRDVDDLDNLLRFSISALPGVQRSATMVCLKTVKTRGSVLAAAERKRRFG